MNIKEIKEVNYLYNKHNEELEKERKNLYNINNNIDIEEFENLEYKEVKEIIELFKYRISDESVKNKMIMIYENKRNELYPKLLSAIYYPELNNAYFLTKNQIKLVDDLLGGWRVKNYLNYSFQRDTLLNDDLYDKLIEFLYNNKIISKSYKFICNECENTINVLDEEEYDKAKKIFNTPELERTEEDWDYSFFDLGCMECDYWEEIDTLEKFEQCNIEIIYKLEKQADRSMEKL